MLNRITYVTCTLIKYLEGKEVTLNVLINMKQIVKLLEKESLNLHYGMIVNMDLINGRYFVTATLNIKSCMLLYSLMNLLIKIISNLFKLYAHEKTDNNYSAL